MCSLQLGLKPSSSAVLFRHPAPSSPSVLLFLSGSCSRAVAAQPQDGTSRRETTTVYAQSCRIDSCAGHYFVNNYIECPPACYGFWNDLWRWRRALQIKAIGVRAPRSAYSGVCTVKPKRAQVARKAGPRCLRLRNVRLRGFQCSPQKSDSCVCELRSSLFRLLYWPNSSFAISLPQRTEPSRCSNGSSSSHVAAVLFWLDSQGRVQRVTRLAPFFPARITFGPGGSLWAAVS
jgi:hypothetical protein